MLSFRHTLLFSFLLLLTFDFLSAQIPSFSPAGKVEQIIGNTTINVEYERPLVRGRLIYGGLVPWNEVWRTGAGYCTKLRFSKQVTVGGQTVPAGYYALLTIPGEDEWTIILNKDSTLYSAHDYSADLDVARFRTRPKSTSRYYEALTIDLDLEYENARLYLSWAETQVNFPIMTSTSAETLDYIEELLSAPPSDTVNYAYAAEYLFFARGDMRQALALTERQLATSENEYAYDMRRQIFEYLGYREKALAEVHRAIAFRKANPLDAANQAWSLREWGAHEARLK